MKRTSLRSVQKMTPFLVIFAAMLIVYAPGALGFSKGIMTSDAAFDPATGGCTASGCHGGGEFAVQGAAITVTFTDADGVVIGGVYEHGATYDVTIHLDELNAPGMAQHAGFNLWTDGGELATVDDTARLHDSGMEATHTGPGFTEWHLQWTAPDEGVVNFRLFVNDVDGSFAPDEPDQVYMTIFSITDGSFAMPGAAVEEAEAHYGVSLPQYWLGLTALAMMLVIMVFAFVYLKYVSPHNADQKDR